MEPRTPPDKAHADGYRTVKQLAVVWGCAVTTAKRKVDDGMERGALESVRLTGTAGTAYRPKR